MVHDRRLGLRFGFMALSRGLRIQEFRVQARRFVFAVGILGILGVVVWFRVSAIPSRKPPTP